MSMPKLTAAEYAALGPEGRRRLVRLQKEHAATVARFRDRSRYPQPGRVAALAAIEGRITALIRSARSSPPRPEPWPMNLTITPAMRAALNPRTRSTLDDLLERRDALLSELAAFAPSRREEAAYLDRAASLAGVNRRLAMLAKLAR